MPRSDTARAQYPDASPSGALIPQHLRNALGAVTLADVAAEDGG